MPARYASRPDQPAALSAGRTWASAGRRVVIATTTNTNERCRGHVYGLSAAELENSPWIFSTFLGLVQAIRSSGQRYNGLGMGIHLVPADFAWLSDVRLREVLLANFRERVQEAVRDVAMSRGFLRGTGNVRVLDVGNAIEVELAGGKAVALEKGVRPHQMTQLEGRIVSIRTPGGVAFRQASRLSLMMGKFRSRGFHGRHEVKAAIDRAFANSAEAVVEAKAELEAMSPPRVRDIVGIR